MVVSPVHECRSFALKAWWHQVGMVFIP